MALSPDLSKGVEPPNKAQASVGGALAGPQMQWLHWFREMLPESGWLVLYSGADLACHAQWPSKISLSCELPNIAAQAIARREPCQCVLPEDESQDVLAIPFFFADEQIAVLVIDSQCLTTKQKQSSVRLADWASHWLQVSGNDDETVIPADDFLDLSNQIMTDFEQRANIDSACFVMVNKVADFLDSSRVSVAEVVNGKPRLLAVSGQSKIDSRRNSSQQLIHALQEVVSNARPTEYTEINPSTELPAHHQLHLTNGGCSVFGLLHAASGKPASIALLIEQPDLKTTGCIVNVHDAQLREAMALLGVLLHSHRSMHRRLSDQAHALLASVREKRFFDKHLLVFVCGLLAITAFLLPVPHRVTVKAMIDASDRQVLVAPQAGYILSAHARAGDKVVAGSLLATLDDQDLQLVVAKWQGERQKNRQEYAKALAQHNRIELSRLRADVLRIDAELALAEQQLKRSEIRAPFDGVLLSGDLSQSLGSPVEQGAVLFEIGSTDTYRLTMDVNEHDIAYISEGQTAKIRMTALPGQNWQARLETVLPVAIAQQGESVFRVPADVLGDAQALRPGMAGVGKVSVGSRSLIWVVTHAITDRMRILAWKLGLIR